MSMQPHPWPEVPAGTAKIARRAFRKGSLAMRARDELGAWYQDEGFRVLYGTRGAPGWLAGVIDVSWREVYGQRIDGFRLPDSTARRADLAVRYGRDGYHLLRQVHDPGAPRWLAGLPAVQALRRIWVQQFCLEAGAGGEKVIWRGEEQGLPPARARLGLAV
jgi:hypothetical protein